MSAASPSTATATRNRSKRKQPGSAILRARKLLTRFDLTEPSDHLFHWGALCSRVYNRVAKKSIDVSEYRFQEFPKMKYHPKHEPRIVQNAQEEKALGRGWASSPNDLPKPLRAIVTLREEVKPWWEEWKWLFAAIGVVLGTIATLIKFWR